MAAFHQRKKPSPSNNPSTFLLQLPDNSEKPRRQDARLAHLPTISSVDVVLLFVFFVAAFATRFYRIATPPAGDKRKYPVTQCANCPTAIIILACIVTSGFFDIHPPLGKLTLGYGSYLLGYRPEPTFVIEKIGNLYPTHVKYHLVRYISAAFSVATVPLTYAVARSMRLSPVGAFAATVSVLLDFLGVIEGRLILMDSQLLFFCQLALLCALVLWRTSPGTQSRRVLLLMTGAVCGAAFSIKHTALATPGLIAIISFFGLHFLADPLPLVDCVIAVVVGLVVYVTPFYVMFSTLWKSGGKYDKFMPEHFRQTLIGSEQYDPSAKRESFFRLFIYLNRRMVQSNASIKKRHTWESDWYQWIVNWRGVLYYVLRETKDGVQHRSQIYLLGNPVVIATVLLSVILFLTILLVSVRYRKLRIVSVSLPRLEWARSTGIFLLCGWLCNLLPYILVDRAAFIYHYIPGLFYGQLLNGALFDILPRKLGMGLVAIYSATAAAAFVYWAPWIYGQPMTEAEHLSRRWLPKWT